MLPQLQRWPVVVLLVLAPAAAAAEQRAAEEQLAFPESGLAPTYVIDRIEIRGNDKTHDAVVQRALAVSAGDRLSVDDPRFEISRLRVIGLGYFSDVRLRLEKGAQRGRVVLVVEVVERGTIVLTELFLGTSEATTAWGGLGLAENNFLGRGISVEGAFLHGSTPEVEEAQLQQSYRLRVGSRQLAGRSLSLSGSFMYLDGSDFFRRAGSEASSDPDDFLSIRYRRIGGTLGVGFDLTRVLRLYLDYRGESIEASLPGGAVRRVPDGTLEPIDFGIRDGPSVLSSVTAMLERDTRSDPVLPQRGSLLTVSSMGSSTFLGSTYDFFKLWVFYEHYLPLRWSHVLALGGQGGIIFGQAPFFERFFIGDLNDLVPGRALGLNFSTLPSRDIFGTSIDSKRYEEVALRGTVEYTIPWFRGGRFAYGGDFFLRAGLIFMTSLDEMRVRDRPLAESIPVDLTLDAGLRLDTYIGIFRLSVGNFLGRIPF